MNKRDEIKAKLGADEFLFDGMEDELFDVRPLIAEGKHPVCAKCGTRLQVALTPQQAKANGHPPGVYCPTNSSHCQIVLNFARTRS
jgi:hypothetical protein